MAYQGFLPLPLNVSYVNIVVRVKTSITEKRFEKQTVLSMKGGRLSGGLDLGWDTESLLKASSIDLEIDMEPVEAFDLNRQEIAKIDW